MQKACETQVWPEEMRWMRHGSLLQQASVYSELLSQHASFVFHVLVVADVRDSMSDGAAGMHKV